MPQEPKKRHSRARQGKRRAAIRLAVAKTVVCPNCKAPILAHKICKKCGYYKGKMVLDLAKKSKLNEEKSSETGKKVETEKNK
jgi:large subunit ribosomal protein L32